MIAGMMTNVFMILILATPGALRAADRGLAAKQADDADLTAMAEDIEIMQRVLSEVLTRRFDFGSEKSAGLLNSSMRGPSDAEGGANGPKADEAARLFTSALTYRAGTYVPRGSNYFDIEGVYVPGTGVFYTLQFQVDLKEIEATEPKEAPKNDLWGEMEDEVRGKLRPTAFNSRSSSESPRQYAINQEDLDETVTALLEAVAIYGAKIEQLADDESIILAARVSPRVPSSPTNIQSFYGRLVSSIDATMEYRVVIKVPVAAIQAFNAKKIDLRGVRSRSDITQYKSHTRNRSWYAGTADR